MLIGRPEAAISQRLTNFCKAPLKKKCYANKPNTIKHLKANIRNAITERQPH